jgi:hypothetical protein
MAKIGTREFAGLTSTFLTDGKRGMEKPTARNVTKSAFTERIRSLFFSGAPADAVRSAASRKLHPVHNDPNIYVVPHFLTPRELDHFDELITARRAAFKHSHTDSSSGEQLVVEERTSISLPLPKALDAVIRAIESRAADLVGLPADHVEPLQVVHYTNGARFDMHHDVAPITLRSEREADEGASPVPVDGASGPSGPNGVSQRSSSSSSSSIPAGEGRLPPRLSAADVVVEKQEGPKRLVTLFVYLNTLPDGIGHTDFPLLQADDGQGRSFSVRPRSGTALVFCNVDEHGEPDPRLCHRACPVPEGHVKFGVNIWISDVSQQAHATSSLAASAAKFRGSAAKPGKGLLAPLLYAELGDLPPPPPAALVGLAVRRTFQFTGRGASASGTYTGLVSSHCPTNGYHLEYSDGDEEDIDAEDLLALPLAEPGALVGRRVSKHFPGHGRFEGEVAACDDPAAQTYTVGYDDGDGESQLPLAEVLRILLPAKSAARKRKRGGGGGPAKGKQPQAE